MAAKEGVGPVTLNVAAVTDSGSMRKPVGTSNVAFTLADGQTSTAALAGKVESTEAFADSTGPAVKMV
jgi:hypothetical protein